MTGPRAWLALATLLMAFGGSAVAEELVTRDGQIIKTQGPWEVHGKLLVFKLADGTLASLRLDEADLDASERRAQEAERRARLAREESMRPAPEPPVASMVLTDKDVSHAPDLGEQPEPEGGSLDDLIAGADDQGGAGDAATDGDEGAGDGEGQDDTVGGAVAPAERGVQVVQWSQEADGDAGLEVRGVIQNLGSSFATSLSVNALFYDETGGLVAAREVQFEQGPLGPGARRDFSVSLPPTLAYEEIKFQVVGRGFRSVGQSVRTEPQQPELDRFDVP